MDFRFKLFTGVHLTLALLCFCLSGPTEGVVFFKEYDDSDLEEEKGSMAYGKGSISRKRKR